MSLFLSRQFIPSPAEPGPAKWHTSEYTPASTSGFSPHPFALIPCVTLTPSPGSPPLLEHQAIPATRVPAKMTGTHRAGLNWPAKHTSTVSSGVSPDDVRSLYHRESAQMMCLHPAVGRLHSWNGLTCQTCVHPAAGHLLGWPKLVYQMGPGRDIRHPYGWTGLTCQTCVGPTVGRPLGWPKLAFQIKLDTAVGHPLGWPKLACQKDIGCDVRYPPGWHKLIYQKLRIPKVPCGQ